MPYQPIRSAPRLLALLALLALPFADPASGQDAGAGDRLVVEADGGLAWERDNRRYVATGNAVARQGDVVFTAGRIEAHYLEGAAGEGIEMTRIEGVGGAELRKGDITARSARIDYDLAADRIAMTGGEPSVESSGSGITARSGRIDYDLAADRIVMTGAEPSIESAGGRITAAGSIDYERARREVRAEGQVVVALEDGRRLRASRVFAKVNRNEDTFDFVRASGDAEISSTEADGGRQASADEIEDTAAEGLAVLSGSVAIFSGGNSLTGDRAEFEIANGTSRMLSGAGRVEGVFTSGGQP